VGAITLATTARNAAADAVVDLVDAGSGAGYVEIRTGAQPASPQVAATGTLLATLTLNDPAYGSAATGVATLDNTPEPSATAVATGTAGWARVYDSNANPVMDGACGTSGAFVNLATTSITSGTTVSITSGSYTQPAS
jgi:hypothetical protein